LVHGRTRFPPPSRARSGSGTNGARNSVWPRSAGQRTTSSSTSSAASLVTVTVIWPPASGATSVATDTETVLGSIAPGEARLSGGSGVAAGVAASVSAGVAPADFAPDSAAVGSAVPEAEVSGCAVHAATSVAATSAAPSHARVRAAPPNEGRLERGLTGGRSIMDRRSDRQGNRRRVIARSPSRMTGYDRRRRCRPSRQRRPRCHCRYGCGSAGRSCSSP
jgi:hypothetical protein